MRIPPDLIVIFAGISAALHIGKLPPAIPVLEQAMGLDLVTGGFLLSMVMLAGLTLSIVVGTAAEALGLRRALIGGLLLLGIGSLHRLIWVGFVAMCSSAWLSFAVLSPGWGQFASVLLFSAVGGMIPGALFYLSVLVSPDEACISSTVGWMQQWSSLGQFLGPPAVALVASHVGSWQWTWGVTGALAVAGILTTALLAQQQGAARTAWHS